MKRPQDSLWVFQSGFSFLVLVLALIGLPQPLAAQNDLPQLAPLGGPQALSAKVESTTSSSVKLSWDAIADAREIRVSFGPEPSDMPNTALPLASKPQKLGGRTTQMTLTGLAAAVDVFIRIEADTPKGVKSANLHARTLGGPRAKLDNALREAHLMGPSILMLTLANGKGESWQKANWSLTRLDGRPLPIRQIHRRSIPVGAPGYQIGPNKPTDDARMDVDHQLFFMLSEPVGEKDILTIKGPQGLRITLPFSDRYLETPVIQVNQVGYNPRAKQRYAYVYGYLGDGGKLSLNDFPAVAEVLAEGANPLFPRQATLSGAPIRHRATNDWDAGGDVREIDLHNVPAAETVRYRIRIPGIGVSWPTAVSELAVFKAFYIAARGLFHNRWGAELTPEATFWARPAAHTEAYTGTQTDFNRMHPPNTPKTGKRPLTGGYHDAGDYDQRPMHTVIPMLLMSAYELNPFKFTDGQLTLPESGNGIPDLLDEALWGVKGWEALQEPDGGVRIGVESYKHPYGIYLANEDPLPYWTYGVHPNITARAAGLFAQAARLLRKFDPQRTKELTEKAVKAFNYARRNQAAPADMLYATGELLLLTGQTPYRSEFDKAWTTMGPYGAFNKLALFHQPTPNAVAHAMENRNEAFAHADYLTAYLASPAASPHIREIVQRWMPQFIKGMIETIAKSHAHRNGRRFKDPVTWGKGATMGRYSDTAIFAMRSIGIDSKTKQDLFDAMSLNADYILGCNPLGMVFYTGLGSRHPEEPLHLDSLAWIKKGKGAVPGIPVFGPVDGPPRAPWSKAAVDTFYPPMQEQPLALRYGDVRTLVPCNESTVWGDYAPNIKLFAALINYNMKPPDSWKPGGADQANPLP